MISLADSFLRVKSRATACCSVTSDSQQSILNVHDLCNVLVLLSRDSFLTARSFNQNRFIPMIESRLPFPDMGLKGSSRTFEPLCVSTYTGVKSPEAPGLFLDAVKLMVIRTIYNWWSWPLLAITHIRRSIQLWKTLWMPSNVGSFRLSGIADKICSSL
jgi:hypothetical protein